MVRRTIVHLEDDLDGGTAQETVTFGLDGKLFEIDLSAKNATKLRKAFAAYITAGRRLGKAAAAPPRVPSPRDGDVDDSAAIRAWARDNGLEVSQRGRVSAFIRAAYHSSAES